MFSKIQTCSKLPPFWLPRKLTKVWEWFFPWKDVPDNITFHGTSKTIYYSGGGKNKTSRYIRAVVHFNKEDV